MFCLFLSKTLKCFRLSFHSLGPAEGQRLEQEKIIFGEAAADLHPAGKSFALQTQTQLGVYFCPSAEQRAAVTHLTEGRTGSSLYKHSYRIFQDFKAH